MAAGRREENHFFAPQGQNPPQNRQNPRNRNENPHRQSRPAASRIADSSNRSRQPTGDLRPPSLGEKSRKGFPLPGFRRKPERIRIIFPGDTRGGKNSSHGATCRGRPGRARRQSGALSPPAERRGWLVEMAPPFPRNTTRSEVWPQGRLWAGLRPRPSGVTGHRLSALGALRRGLLAGENRLGDFSQRRACRRRAARPSGA